MANTKKLEKDLDEGLKELLLNMESEKFTEYFKNLIKKYYDVLFTFEEDYSKILENWIASAPKYNFEIFELIVPEVDIVEEIKKDLRKC